MGRIRTIKPEFPQSEAIGRLSRDARLLFIQLWTIADDSGRTRGNSRILASLLYPFDDDVLGLIDLWIEELQREKCIVRYTRDGNTYVEILNWLKHQKIDKPSPSKIPGFVEPSPNPRETSGTDLGPTTKDLGPSTGNTSCPPATQPDDSAPKKSDIGSAIERLFDYYLRKLGRDRSRYTLTPSRKEKARIRLEERVKIRESLEEAVAEAKQCIDNLAASEYHRTNGHIDWTEQIFRSAEEFEKRLNWERPQGGSHGTNRQLSGQSAAERKREREIDAFQQVFGDVIGTADGGGDWEAGIANKGELSGSGSNTGNARPVARVLDGDGSGIRIASSA